MGKDKKKEKKKACWFTVIRHLACGLEPVAAQACTRFVYPPQRFLLQCVLVDTPAANNTVDAHGNIQYLPFFLPSPIAGEYNAILIPSLVYIVVKKLLQSRRRHNRLVTTKQTTITSTMPETPAQADGLLAAEDDLAAHLVDGQVNDAAEAGVAGQTGCVAEDVGSTAR